MEGQIYRRKTKDDRQTENRQMGQISETAKFQAAKSSGQKEGWKHSRHVVALKA